MKIHRFAVTRPLEPRQSLFEVLLEEMNVELDVHVSEVVVEVDAIVRIIVDDDPGDGLDTPPSRELIFGGCEPTNVRIIHERGVATMTLAAPIEVNDIFDVVLFWAVLSWSELCEELLEAESLT